MADSVAFLDERGTDAFDFYFLGGVALAPPDVHSLAEWVREFKRALHPEYDPNEWYMKGSGQSIYRGRRQDDTRQQAFDRWVAWAQRIEHLAVRYSFHATLVLPRKLIGRAGTRPMQRPEQVDCVFKAAMVATLAGLSLRGGRTVDLFVDRVEGAQRDAVMWGVEAINQAAQAEAGLVGVDAVEEVAKDECASDAAHILQFVDMNIYALSRFILPSGSNILADFERWPLTHATGNADPRLGAQAAQVPDEAIQRYFDIAKLYHHLRFRFLKNHVSPAGVRQSSIVLVAGENHMNFAHDVDIAIWSFCNTMWQGWTKERMLMNLNEYE